MPAAGRYLDTSRAVAPELVKATTVPSPSPSAASAVARAMAEAEEPGAPTNLGGGATPGPASASTQMAAIASTARTG